MQRNEIKILFLWNLQYRAEKNAEFDLMYPGLKSNFNRYKMFHNSTGSSFPLRANYKKFEKKYVPSHTE